MWGFLFYFDRFAGPVFICQTFSVEFFLSLFLTGRFLNPYPALDKRRQCETITGRSVCPYKSVASLTTEGSKMTETTSCPYLFDDPNRDSRPVFEYAEPLPMTPEEVKARGWEQVDVVFITGDAYVDAPSFANGLLARVLETDGFSVAILSQPNWNSVEDFRKFGRPRLAFCVSAGNMDSMLNHYTASRKIRNDDSYTPGGKIGRRPDRATLSYSALLAQSNVKIYKFSGGFNHAKQVVCDDEIACCGTINFDYRSLYFHFENGVLFTSPDAIASMKKDFIDTFAKSSDETENFKLRLKRRNILYDNMIRLISPLF